MKLWTRVVSCRNGLTEWPPRLTLMVVAAMGSASAARGSSYTAPGGLLGAMVRSTGRRRSVTRLHRVALHLAADLPPLIQQLQHEVHLARRGHTPQATTLEELLATRISCLQLNSEQEHTAAVAQAVQTIRGLGLEQFAIALDTQGWTVVPPSITGLTPQRVEALRQAIFRVAADRRSENCTDGIRDVNDATNAQADGMERCYMVLYEDRVFEEALMNPVMRCLISYLLGDDIVLSSSIATIKRQGSAPFVMHADGPTEDRSHPLGAAAMFCLSDFQGEEGGATAFVPFSHRVGTAPWRDDLINPSVVGAEAVSAAAGSLLVWSEATWHGAFPRLLPEGERVDLLFYHVLSSMLTEETYRETVTDEVLARNTSEFAQLMGVNVFQGWGAEGPGVKLREQTDRMKRLGLR